MGLCCSYSRMGKILLQKMIIKGGVKMSSVESFGANKSSISDYPRNLIIFTDPGVDDAVAIREILTNIPDGISVFICPVAGNGPKEITMRNAQLIANDKVKAILNGSPIDSIHTELTPEYTGDDGLGDCTFFKNYVPISVPVVPLADYTSVMDIKLPTDMICIAPFKVSLEWLRQFILDSDPVLIENIYVMGGCEKAGNMGEGDNMLEFNQYLAPEVFIDFITLAKQLTETYLTTNLHIATLESCENGLLDFMDYPIEKVEMDEMEKALFLAGKELAVQRGEQSYYVYDLTIAWKYLMDLGIYADGFIYKSHLLKGTDIFADSIIIPFVAFPNPWDSVEGWCINGRYC